MTFNTIVVGVDGRQGGRDALALAERMRGTAGELVAVQAYPYEYYVSRGSNADFEALMRDEVVQKLKAEIEYAGVDARAVVVPDGSAARALHHAAQRHGADLIVVGSAHRGHVGRVLAGDVASSTLHGSPCAVLIAPGRYAQHPRELARIGACFDESPESRAAVDLAGDLALAAGAELEVMTVLEPSWPWAAYPNSYRDWSEDSRTIRAATEASLSALVAKLGPNVSGKVLEGDPVRELVFAGQQLDLLVCGSRAYGPLNRLLLGSTSGRLVHEAPCPVMVLPRGVTETAAIDDSTKVPAHAS